MITSTAAGVAMITLSCPPVNALTIDGYHQVTPAFTAIARSDDASDDI